MTLAVALVVIASFIASRTNASRSGFNISATKYRRGEVLRLPRPTRPSQCALL